MTQQRRERLLAPPVYAPAPASVPAAAGQQRQQAATKRSISTPAFPSGASGTRGFSVVASRIPLRVQPSAARSHVREVGHFSSGTAADDEVAVSDDEDVEEISSFQAEYERLAAYESNLEASSDQLSEFEFSRPRINFRANDMSNLEFENVRDSMEVRPHSTSVGEKIKPIKRFHGFGSYKRNCRINIENKQFKYE